MLTIPAKWAASWGDVWTSWPATSGVIAWSTQSAAPDRTSATTPTWTTSGTALASRHRRSMMSMC